jgi:uncharacterized damage-inducible protein DinB
MGEQFMGARAEQYAKQFEAANNELIAAVEGLSEQQWRTKTNPEGWSVGVVAHHLATSHGPVSGFAQAIANGQSVPPLTMDMIHQGNAKHAQENANCGKAETLALLREANAAAAKAISGLSDEQLDKSADVIGNPMTSAAVIEHILIGHTTQHTASIKEVVGS